MAVFAIVATVSETALREAVLGVYGVESHQLSPSCWFVVDEGTTKSVSDKLGLTSGGIGAQGVVLSLTGYSGWAPVAAWEWLAVHGATPNG